MMWSSRDPPRAHHVLQLNPSSRFEQKKLSHLSGKGLWKTYKIDVKKIKLFGHIELNARESDVSGSVGKHLQDQVPFLVSGSPWEVSFHVKTIWHIWSAPYTLILDQRGHLHIQRLYNGQEKTRPARGSYMNCVDWWVNWATALLYTNTRRQGGIRHFDLIHLLLTNYGYALRTWFKMSLAVRRAACACVRRGESQHLLVKSRSACGLPCVLCCLLD